MNGYDAASELCNELLERPFDEYNELSDAKRKNIELKYDPKTYVLKHNYDPRFENEESTEREKSGDLSDMLPLEGDGD